MQFLNRRLMLAAWSFITFGLLQYTIINASDVTTVVPNSTPAAALSTETSQYLLPCSMMMPAMTAPVLMNKPFVLCRPLDAAGDTNSRVPLSTNTTVAGDNVQSTPIKTETTPEIQSVPENLNVDGNRTSVEERNSSSNVFAVLLMFLLFFMVLCVLGIIYLIWPRKPQKSTSKMRIKSIEEILGNQAPRNVKLPKELHFD